MQICTTTHEHQHNIKSWLSEFYPILRFGRELTSKDTCINHIPGSVNAHYHKIQYSVQKVLKAFRMLNPQAKTSQSEKSSFSDLL